MSNTILRIENFSKSFVVHEQGKVIPSSSNVNLTVSSGRLTALIGPTGAGKSSILKSIYRTYLPSSGRLLYTTESGNVVDLATADEHQILRLRQTEIGFVTQFLRTVPRQSSENIVAAQLLKRQGNKAPALQAARAMLTQLNLPKQLWQLAPATFSGGEKQRVNLAREFVLSPRLLLLDEPTASLDPATTERVVKQIEVLKKRGTGILAIFHSPDLIERLGDTIVELTPPVHPEPLVLSKH
jgi:alpha-D-ribose 1-methylphosphonate 5-triphosphate synthase subunit PhnL